MKRSIRTAGAALMTVAAATLAGCSTAGPFVTNVSSDGKGDILVQKNYVYCNGFTGVISTDTNSIIEVIRVLPEPAPQQK